MLNTQKLKELLNNLNNQEQIWLYGYLDGTLAQNVESQVLPQISVKFTKVGILFVTETGNSKKIAQELSAYIKKHLNIVSKIYNAQTFKPKQLKQEEYLFVIASTHGEGEVPEAGKTLFDFLSTTDEQFNNISYAVLALGDSSYPLYCKAGLDFHELFTKKKAIPLLQPKLIDENLTGVNEWFEEVAKVIGGGAPCFADGDRVKRGGEPSEQGGATQMGKVEFEAKVIENICLSDVGSNKAVHHIAFETDGVHYECGDALSVVPITNDGKTHTPRLYSIASSPQYHLGEIHLLVARIDDGVCSNYLAELPLDAKIECKISRNNLFKLPENDRNVIMIGAGTGLAPFRGFLFERQVIGATGKNWLFFGEQKSTTDFYYQTELQELLADGTITNLSLAFSRDSDQKVYVQHKMMGQAKEFFTWIEAGAILYVCGAKDPMSRDVENTLLEIIAVQSGKGEDFAKEYLNNMIDNDRYKKDVY